MKITKIEKKKRLYLVEFDDNDALYVTEDTIVHFMLSKDKVLDNDQLEDIKHFAQLSYGKNLALYFLSFQQRSQKQVKDYLLKHDIDESIIPDIIHHLQQDKWLDDAKLAETYIRQNQLNGDKGPQVLKQKLLQKALQVMTLILSYLKLTSTNLHKKYPKNSSVSTKENFLPKL